MIASGSASLDQGSHLQDIHYFEQAINHCATQYPASEQRVYSSRSLVETLYYINLSSSSSAALGAIVIDTLCSGVVLKSLYLD